MYKICIFITLFGTILVLVGTIKLFLLEHEKKGVGVLTMHITVLMFHFDIILTCNEKCTLSWDAGWMLQICLSVHDEFELIKFNI